MVAALAKKVAGRPKFSLNIPPRELIPLHVPRSVPPAAPAAASARRHCRTLSVSSISNTSAPVSARSQGGASPYQSAGRSYHQSSAGQRPQPPQPSQQQALLPFRASLVCPRLYVGNAVDAAALPALRARNIRYVLNVAAECADTNAAAALEADGIQVLHVPLRDTSAAASDALREFPRICQFIDAGLRDARGSSVLVHCLYGVSRSATAALAYLLASAAATAATAAVSAPTSTAALPESPVPPLATWTMHPPSTAATQGDEPEQQSVDRACRISKQGDSPAPSSPRSRDVAEEAVYAALHAMQEARPDVQPNDGFIGALIEWRARCSHAESRM